jgi:hypothetical protein
VSDIPVHREQADGGTIFFAPEDPASLAAAVAAVEAELTPGPDREFEKVAAQSLNEQVGQSPQRFLDILAAAATR